MKAFSKKDYKPHNCPYIKILVKDKPMFPVLGNHEIMHFKLRKPSLYKDLGTSINGLNSFKEFFNWEQFIRQKDIILPIPSELSENLYAQLIGELHQDSQKALLNRHYIKCENGNYNLKIFEDVITKSKNRNLPQITNYFLNCRQTVVKDLFPIFRKLGYNVLPVLTSDNMICYAFEIQGTVYLVMDSMARGWQYPVFSKLKKALYPDKKDQHKLHLFSRHALNGQYGFYKSIAAYVKENRKKMVFLMHHSPINSLDKIDGSSMEYNSKLILGVNYEKKE